jgi:adenine-specific DNA methylase
MWASEGEFVAHTFGRQALPMVWDFAEVNPFSGKTGGWTVRSNGSQGSLGNSRHRLTPGR